MEVTKALPKTSAEKNENSAGLNRRKFLTRLGGAASIAAIAASCQKTSLSPSASSSSTDQIKFGGIDFGKGDIAILNYAYLLEQLEAAFYIHVVQTPYPNMNPWEQNTLNDIMNHEVAHREFFKTAIGDSAIPVLEFDFTSINFASRDSVLGAAKTFEDTGVSAYNGAAAKIVSVDYLLTAGKIVSVEARHAGLIRDLINPGSFADSTAVDANGLDLVAEPRDVLKAVSIYIMKPTIDFNHLPSNF